MRTLTTWLPVLAATSLLSLALLVPTSAVAFTVLTIAGVNSVPSGLGSVTTIDDEAGNPVKVWTTTTFLVDELGFDSGSGIQTMQINDLALPDVSGALSTFWSFTFNPTGPFVQFPLDSDGGTTVLPDLPAFLDTNTGHFWTESFIVRATRANTATGPQVAAHYEMFFTTDASGVASPTSVLPTQCAGYTTPSDLPNVLVQQGAGKPLGVSGSANGTPVGADQMVITAVACPIYDNGNIQAWPPSNATIDETGIILNLIAIPSAISFFDEDGDGVIDVVDNCPNDPNPSQTDVDSNGVGDTCNDFEDSDGDDWADSLDNCPDDFNPNQENGDGDELGDVCDPFPDDPDHDLAQCSLDLGQAQTEILVCEDAFTQVSSDLTQTQTDLNQCSTDLATCLETPGGIPDEDGDGEADPTDLCAETSTGSTVDTAGCSQDQYCEGVAITDLGAAFRCLYSDWRNDEPFGLPQDCAVRFDGSGWFGLHCTAP